MRFWDTIKQVFGNKSHKSEKEQLAELYSACEQCTKCELANSRVKVIHGLGNPSNCKILFITAKPLNKQEQNLLVKKLSSQKIFIDRDYYVTNIVKCYTKTQISLPDIDAVKACAPILKKEIDIVKPSLIVALGLETARLLAGNQEPLPSSLRGKFVTAKPSSPVFQAGTKIFNTFYPAYVIKNPKAMAAFEDDIVKIKSMYEFEKTRNI